MSESISVAVDGAAAQPARKRVSLRTNFTWTFAGTAIHAFCSWGVLVVIARLGGTVALGKYALAFAISSPVYALAGMNLRAALVADVRHRFEFEDYLLFRGLMALAATVVTVGIALATAADSISLIIAVTLWQCVASVSDIYYGALQKHERMDVIGKSLMLKGIGGVAATAVAMLLFESVGAAVAASLVTRLGVLVLYDVPQSAVTRNWSRPNMRLLAQLLWLCLPLGIVIALLSLADNIPRYYIDAYVGTQALGIYSAIAGLISVGNTAVSALGQSASPRLAILYGAGESRSFDALLGRLMLIGGLAGTAGILIAVTFGPEVLTAVYKTDYHLYRKEIVWLMVAGAIGYVAQFPGYALTAAARFRVQVPLIAAMTATCAIASALFVPSLGLSGAIWALTLAAIVQFAGGWIGLFQARLIPRLLD